MKGLFKISTAPTTITTKLYIFYMWKKEKIMEIKIMQNELLSLINISLRAISLKNNTSILEGILFIAKDNGLT